MAEEMQNENELDLTAAAADAENAATPAEVADSTEASGEQVVNSNAHWYVVHTYSGYENKVKANIEKTVENRYLEDQILEVRVPMQDVGELKNGTKKSVSKKMFPGYVLINMIMNDDTWYVVRNTRGVTGFVGPGSKPVPLTDVEMRSLGIRDNNADIEVDFAEGDTVSVIGGVWKDTVGVIQSVNISKQTVKKHIRFLYPVKRSLKLFPVEDIVPCILKYTYVSHIRIQSKMHGILYFLNKVICI